jgi:hypothetical protein
MLQQEHISILKVKDGGSFSYRMMVLTRQSVCSHSSQDRNAEVPPKRIGTKLGTYICASN